MKKLFALLVMTLMAICTNAQDVARLGYWNRSGFVELTPDKSFIYKYVQAMDDESQRVLNDLYAAMGETGDKSILKRNEGGWYVKNDYPLPDGNFYESDFYKNDSEAHGNELYVILPRYELFLNSRGHIDELLEFLGSKVSVESEYGADIEGGTCYKMTCNMKTSEDVLEVGMQVHELEFEGLAYFIPQKFSLDLNYDSYLINVLTDSAKGTSENSLKLIYEMNWEGVWPGVFDGDDIWAQTDEGMAITTSQQMKYMWTLYSVIGLRFSLEQGRDYIVRLTMKVPSEGTYQVRLGSRLGGDENVWFSCEVPVTADDDFQVIDVECSDFPGNVLGDAYVMLGSGWVVGTTIVKQVKIYEKLETGSRGDQTAIKAEKAEKVDNTSYNLIGQKVNASYKGVVINNGKKMLMK